MPEAAATARPVPRALALFALGSLALLLVPSVTLTPSGLGGDVPVALVGEAVLLALLGVSLGRGPARDRGETLAGYLLSLLALGVLAGVGWLAVEELWTAALVVTIGGATVAYGLHRYERVVLGLAGGDT